MAAAAVYAVASPRSLATGGSALGLTSAVAATPGAAASIAGSAGASGSTQASPTAATATATTPGAGAAEFGLLAALKSLAAACALSTLENAFRRLRIDARSWRLLIRSRLPDNEIAAGITGLKDALTELVARVMNKSKGARIRAETVTASPAYEKEFASAHTVYSTATALYRQIFAYLKPQFAETETYMEERTATLSRAAAAANAAAAAYARARSADGVGGGDDGDDAVGAAVDRDIAAAAAAGGAAAPTTAPVILDFKALYPSVRDTLRRVEQRHALQREQALAAHAKAVRRAQRQARRDERERARLQRRTDRRLLRAAQRKAQLATQQQHEQALQAAAAEQDKKKRRVGGGGGGAGLLNRTGGAASPTRVAGTKSGTPGSSTKSPHRGGRKASDAKAPATVTDADEGEGEDGDRARDRERDGDTAGESSSSAQSDGSAGDSDTEPDTPNTDDDTASSSSAAGGSVVAGLNNSSGGGGVRGGSAPPRHRKDSSVGSAVSALDAAVAAVVSAGASVASASAFDAPPLSPAVMFSVRSGGHGSRPGSSASVRAVPRPAAPTPNVATAGTAATTSPARGGSAGVTPSAAALLTLPGAASSTSSAGASSGPDHTRAHSAGVAPIAPTPPAAAKPKAGLRIKPVSVGGSGGTRAPPGALAAAAAAAAAAASAATAATPLNEDTADDADGDSEEEVADDPTDDARGAGDDSSNNLPRDADPSAALEREQRERVQALLPKLLGTAPVEVQRRGPKTQAQLQRQQQQRGASAKTRAAAAAAIPESEAAAAARLRRQQERAECVYPLPAPRTQQQQAQAARPPHPEYLYAYATHVVRSLSFVEGLVDIYLYCLMVQFVALCACELRTDGVAYTECVQSLHALASHFIRLGLPVMERLMEVEPTFVRHNMFGLSMRGVERGLHYSDARQLIRKLRVFHAALTSLDIYVFPLTLPAHTTGCKTLCVSHLSSAFVLTGGYDNAVRIWDTTAPPNSHSSSGGPGNGTCLAQFVGHDSIVTWAKFNSADTWLVTGSFDGTIRVWNARTAKLVRVLSGHDDGVLDGDLSGCALSSSTTSDSAVAAGSSSSGSSSAMAAGLTRNELIVSGSMDCTVRLWSTATGQCVRLCTGHKHWVKCVRFTPDAQHFVSTGLDKLILVWSTRLGAATSALSPALGPSVPLSAPTPVPGMAGTSAAAAAGSGGSGSAPPTSTSASAGASAAATSAALNAAAARERDAAAAAAALAASSAVPRSVSDLHDDYVLDMCCFGADAMITASKDKSIRVWNHRTDKQLYVLRNPAYAAAAAAASAAGGAASGATQQSSPAPLSLSVSADQKWLAVGFFDHTVLVYDADNGFACTRQLKVHNDGVLCVRWLDAHGKRLAVGCANGNLQIVDL